MKHEPVLSGKRRTIQMSLPEEHVADAEALGIDLDQLIGDALSVEIRRERDRRWKAEHRDWIEAHARWVEGNELPLEKYRVF